MKSLVSLAMSLLLAAGASAETKFPRGSFEMADLDKAKAHAAAEKKDLAFVYTDKTTTCGLCQGAAAAYIDAVKSKAVIVYVDSKANATWWAKLPEPVRQALTPGKFIPKIAVTDPAASKVSASLTYEAYKEDDGKAIRGLKKAMKAE
ncbi:MAG: hypothetical protein V4689_22855 [Verrucomicrobiota bacterium]